MVDHSFIWEQSRESQGIPLPVLFLLTHPETRQCAAILVVLNARPDAVVGIADAESYINRSTTLEVRGKKDRSMLSPISAGDSEELLNQCSVLKNGFMPARLSGSPVVLEADCHL